MSGSEVSIRPLAFILESFEQRGIATAPLTAGLFNGADLRDPATRVGWDEFAEFMQRAQAAIGGPVALEQHLCNLMPADPRMQGLASLFVSPRQLYLQLAARVARRLYRCVGLRVDEEPDGTLRALVTIPPEYRGSLPMMYATQGTLRAYPRLIGQPPATISAELTPHRGVFLISVPESKTLPARAARALDSGARRLRTLNPFAGRESEEVLDALDMAFAESELLQTANALGHRLVGHRDLRALSDELVSIAREVLCASYVALWVEGPSGALEPVRREGETAPERRCSRPLTVAGREIGRVELDVDREQRGSNLALLDALVPWLALGLQACRDHGASAADEGARVRHERAGAQWGLTPRERQVLELLVRGCSNKEIAAALGASRKTVEVHVTHVLRKAGADSRALLISRFWGGESNRRAG